MKFNKPDEKEPFKFVQYVANLLGTAYINNGFKKEDLNKVQVFFDVEMLRQRRLGFYSWKIDVDMKGGGYGCSVDMEIVYLIKNKVLEIEGITRGYCEYLADYVQSQIRGGEFDILSEDELYNDAYMNEEEEDG